MRGTTVVYAALCCSLIAIGGLILLVPLLTMTLEELQRDFDVDFQEVKGMTDTMWQDLMLLRKGIPLNVERKIRQAGYGDTTKPHSYGKPPSYGYGYTKLKCCCAIEGAVGPSLYQSSQPAYPTSYKCPAGYHGPPGPPGESGMPGSAGQPGSPGEDYPTTNNNIGVTQGYQSITPTQGMAVETSVAATAASLATAITDLHSPVRFVNRAHRVRLAITVRRESPDLMAKKARQAHLDCTENRDMPAGPDIL
uniref:Nematode cuticle collagen N-terminal domain-containing protein n=1 Tax=Plectus sambesii TaxID=2011161 RepID=A0A914WHW8_9BILA